MNSNYWHSRGATIDSVKAICRFTLNSKPCYWPALRAAFEIRKAQISLS